MQMSLMWKRLWLVRASVLAQALLRKANIMQSRIKTIAIAALSILKRYLSLTSENESEWSHGYSKEGLEERIKALCKENELDASEYLDKLVTLRDGSNLL